METAHGRTPQAILVLTGPPSENPLPARVRARVNLLEVRFDLFPQEDWSGIPRDVRRAFPNAKSIATLRLDRDGGRWPDPTSRLPALRKILDLYRWAYVDVEDDSPEREAMLAMVRESGPGVILSRHAFVPQNSEEVSDTIAHMLRAATRENAAVAKWAARLEDIQGILPSLLRQISSLPENNPVPAIFPMGSLSEAGRVAAALASGGWGYAHDGSGPAAPGQISWPVFQALVGSIPPPGQDLSSWLPALERTVELALSPVGSP